MSDATQPGDEQVPYADLFTALAAPFADGEVKVREQAGRKFHYITARTAMNRLDSVLGPSRWWDEYVPGNNGVLCRLTIRLPDGTTLTKCDAGGYAGMADQGDDEKSGVSDAFKRAAVKFGVGRYIYNDGVPDFVLDRLHGDAKQAVLPGGARSSGGGGGSYSGNRGGGGGGYYGGGGGGGKNTPGTYGAGGGGGSSWTHASATDVSHTQGYQTGNGQVIFTYEAVTWIPQVVIM